MALSARLASARVKMRISIRGSGCVMLVGSQQPGSVGVQPPPQGGKDGQARRRFCGACLECGVWERGHPVPPHPEEVRLGGRRPAPQAAAPLRHTALFQETSQKAFESRTTTFVGQSLPASPSVTCPHSEGTRSFCPRGFTARAICS